MNVCTRASYETSVGVTQISDCDLSDGTGDVGLLQLACGIPVIISEVDRTAISF